MVALTVFAVELPHYRHVRPLLEGLIGCRPLPSTVNGVLLVMQNFNHLLARQDGAVIQCVFCTLVLQIAIVQ